MTHRLRLRISPQPTHSSHLMAGDGALHPRLRRVPFCKLAPAVHR